MKPDILFHMENDETYLAHFGINGQKWGIRRYRNEDGTLTEAGKQRYGKYGESKTWKPSDVGNLSDAELKRRNDRLNAESNYKQKTRSHAEKTAKSLANQVVVQTAAVAVATIVVKPIAEAGAKALIKGVTKILVH